MARIAILLSILTTVLWAAPARAQAPTPVYVAIGDSIEFGVGDDTPVPGFGYVPLVADFLATVFQQPVTTHNFGEPFAQTRDIWKDQVPDALAAAIGHAPVVVSWGGGGNDLAAVATGPQAAACRQNQSCLGRFHGLLNEIEQTIDRTIRQLRNTLGPDAVILMRTQYNSLLRPGCGTPESAALATAVLEGVEGTVLDQGLNDRIFAIAEKYDAQVVDIFLPFAANAATLISSDCVHPSGAGYDVIATLSGAAFLAAQ